MSVSADATTDERYWCESCEQRGAALVVTFLDDASGLLLCQLCLDDLFAVGETVQLDFVLTALPR